MATYYCPSSNNPRDAAAPGPMQHYLREPLPTSYSEVAAALPTPTNMMMYMSYSSSSSGSYSDALAGNGNAQQHGIEILSVAASDSSTPPHHQEIFSNVTGCGSHLRVVEHDFRAWRDGGGNEMMLVTNTLGGPASLLHAGAGQNLQGHQGLSLSLGTQIHSGIQIPSSIQYQNPNQGYRSFLGPPNSSMSGDGGNSSSRNNGNGSSRDENSRKAEFCSLGSVLGANQDLIIKVDPSSSSYGMSSSIARTIPHSKYLKAAQQLLVEVVNVRKALKQPDSEKKQYMDELLKGSEETDDGGSKNGTAVLPPAASNPQDLLSNSSSELSHAERQDLQNKMTKLLAMLDEVDRKYKQYYHQMQIVVSSFDAIGGSGAAKPYTALALQTISHHFRCLRDAITGQIRSTRRSLGEQDTSGNSVQVGISRLRYVDQQLRQQRALQQLGMLQQHAWRPQRGLPESSVSILRAWLFEHFLHPYPKDSDKIMLARQTGLTRSQVSNWFINARVRLWKPMVEEMYKEEIGDADIDSNSSSENATKVVTKGGDVRASEERGDDFQQSITSTGRFLDSEMGVGPTTTGAAFRNGGAHGETQTEYGILKLTTGEQRPTPTPTLEECSSSSSLFAPDGGSDGFMAAAYHHMSELGRFGSGTGGVSLTLGLQHCAGGGGGGGHHSFVGMNTRGAADDMYNSAASSVGMQTTADFDYGSWEPAVPIQLLPSSMT